MPLSDNRKAFYIVVVFFVIYLLSFNGIPISDDEQLFAITARNIAVLKHFDAEPLYGDIRILGQYRVEPLHPFLASLWYVPLKWLYNNGLQSFFLLSIVYLSVSAGLLFFLIRHFRYSSELAIEVVFWCGLSTVIWPYSKTFFREPLLLMLVLASWLFFEKIFKNGLIRKLYLILFLIIVFSLFFTKMIYGSVFFAYLVMAYQKMGGSDRNEKKAAIFILFILFFGLIVFYLSQKHDNIFYRYSFSALQDYWTRINSIPRKNFWQTLFLALFSSWKGFFIYSPICIFVFFTPWVANARLRQKLYLLYLPVCVLVSALLFQVITYGDNIWTPPWSVRFLVPSVPLILIAALPVLENLNSFSFGKFIFRCVGILGFFIQLNAILVNSASYTRYLQEKSANFPASEYWSPFTAPAFNQWRLLLDGYPVNLLFVRVIQDSKHTLSVFLLLFCGIFIIGAIVFSLLRNQPLRTHSSVWRLWGVGVLFLVLFSFVIRRDPFYWDLTSPVEQACQKINATPGNNKFVILQPYPSALWLTFANRDCLNGNWFSLPDDKSILKSEPSLYSFDKLFAESENSFSEIWVIREITGNESLVGRRLDFLYKVVSKEKLNGLSEIELILYKHE